MEEFVRRSVERIGLWALVAVAVIGVIVVRFFGPEQTLDENTVFAHVYRVGECVYGQPDGDAGQMVRLEEDRTMLLRSAGLWQNLGRLSRCEATAPGLPEGEVNGAWQLADEAYELVWMADGDVYLSWSGRTAKLSRVDTLSVGVNAGEESSFLKPQWYPEGEEVSMEQLSRCTVRGSVTLVLNLEDYQERLTVKAGRLDETQTLWQTKILSRDRSRTFLLDVEGTPGETLVFEVPFEEGGYRFVLVFE